MIGPRSRVLTSGGSAVASVSAPVEAFPVGTYVGVPAGTSLTATVGIPAPDTTTDYVLYHRITGESVTRPDCPTFENRSWASVLDLANGVNGPGAGETWVFRNCLFSSNADFRAVEVQDMFAVPGTQMQPLVVFENCTFSGNDVLPRALVAGAVWLYRCHLGNAEDAWGGAYWSYAEECNFVASTDGAGDPHQDGVQLAGVGLFSAWRCWFDAGFDPIANSALRVGTEFSACVGIDLYYSSFARGGYNVTFHGASNGITGVNVVGCRWLPGAGFGPVDVVNTSFDSWVNNRFIGGAVIPQPA